MGELKNLLYRKPLVYEGLFRVDELYRTIMRFLQERGYWNVEMKNEEKVLPNGKDIFIFLMPFKKFNDYAKGEFMIELHLAQVKDRTVELHGHKQKYQHGQVQIRFSAQMHTDWRSRWEGSGFAFVFRTLMDKFIKHDFMHKMEDQVVGDCQALQEEVRTYLNMNRYKFEVRTKLQEPALPDLEGKGD